MGKSSHPVIKALLFEGEPLKEVGPLLNGPPALFPTPPLLIQFFLGPPPPFFFYLHERFLMTKCAELADQTKKKQNGLTLKNSNNSAPIMPLFGPCQAHCRRIFQTTK